MKDYRLPENREDYFTQLYSLHLKYRIHPGCVYLAMPELVKKYNLDHEQRLWVAALNGNTQHILTTWRIFKEFPEVPRTEAEQRRFTDWFNENWTTLSFDSDRKYAKKLLPDFVKKYAQLVQSYGSQEKLLTADSFSQLWERVIKEYPGFGRLSTYSYLEYIQIMATIDGADYGAQCDNMFFDDKEGSRSHRNGMFFLLGADDFVYDKRQRDSHDGNYDDFKTKIVPWLNKRVNTYLKNFQQSKYVHQDAGYFTIESALCCFKNSFFGRRHPGCYSDMFQDRIEWYDARGFDSLTKVFKQMREDHLPEWLRRECEITPMKFTDRAKVFPETGFPHRGEYFI